MPFVSAGVYNVEQDLSLYAETVSATIFGIVGVFNKGPLDTETDVSSIERLESLFGRPIDPTSDSSLPQAWYAAREYLRKGNQLKVVRVDSAATPAQYAAISLPGGSDDDLGTAADGATSVPATRTLTSAGSGFVAAGVQIGDYVELHDAVDTGDNGFYQLTAVAATVLTVDRDWPTGSLTNLSFTVWAGKKEGGVDGATSVPATRTLTSAGSTFTTNGVAAGDIVLVNDTGDTGDNGVFVVESVTSETVLKVTRDWPEGSLSGLTFTVYSKIGPDAADGDTTVAGTFTSASAKFSSHGVKAGDILYVKDAVDTGANGYYPITAVASETALTVGYNGTWPASLTNLDYEIWPGSIQLLAQSKGTWITGDVVKVSRNASDKTNVDIKIYDSSEVYLRETIYNVDRTNATTADDVSEYFTASVISNRTEPAAGTWRIATASPIRPVLDFSGGDDGTTGLVDADFIGVTGSSPTGLQALLNPEKTLLSIIAIPGQTSEDIGNALVTFAEARADVMCLPDPPDSPTVSDPQDILDWHNGTLGRTTALNTSYGALSWSWQQIYDEYNDADVWAAPSGFTAAVFAENDNKAAAWYAPAGFKRGKVSSSKALRYSPDQGERDSLASGTARVNPFVNFVGYGIHLFGQTTLLRTTSALNRVNVRRMLIEVEKTIAASTRALIFDPNDDLLFREFKALSDPALEYISSRRGIEEFLTVNATTDTDKDNKTARFKTFIKPVNAAEIIILEYALTSQGADFTELVESA